jgi:hypothetical protein
MHVYGRRKAQEEAATTERLENQINKLHTLPDLDAWIDANITTFAQAVAAFKITGRLLWSHEKRLRKLEQGE